MIIEDSKNNKNYMPCSYMILYILYTFSHTVYNANIHEFLLCDLPHVVQKNTPNIISCHTGNVQ